MIAQQGINLWSVLLPPDLVAVSTAAASVGKWSSSSVKMTVTGGGPDFVANTTIVVAFEAYQAAHTNADLPFTGTQTIVSNSTGGTGWRLDMGASGALSLKMTTGATFNLPNIVAPGLNVICFTVTGAGAIRVSQNGTSPVQLAAAGFVYVSAAAAGQYIVGGVNTALVGSGQPAVNCTTLYVAVKGTTAESDANIQFISTQVNQTERYLPSAVVSGGLGSLVSLWQATDWDGVSGTTTAGSGSSPTTWTVLGAPTKNTIEAENIYVPPEAAFADTHLLLTRNYLGSANPYKLRNPMARVSFRLTGVPSRIGQMVAYDALDTSVTNIGQQCTGLRVGLDPVSVGVWANESHQLRSTDWLPGTFPASTEYEMIDGIGADPDFSGTRRGVCIQKIRVPSSTPIVSWITNTAPPVDRLVIYGDSIVAGLKALAPCTASWAMMVRAYRGSILSDGVGGRAWFNVCHNAGAINAAIAEIIQEVDGTGTNQIWFALGTNDYGLSLWTAAAMQTALGTFIDALHAALPTVTIFLATPIPRVPETANAVGSTLPNYRTAIANVQATRAAYCTLVDGTTLCTTGLLNTDNVHPTQVGHAYMQQKIQPILGYAARKPWLPFPGGSTSNGEGNIYSSGQITDSWVADAAYVDAAAVGQWDPELGAVSYTQATAGFKPTWSATSWASTPPQGAITGDGVDDILHGDPLAAGVTGDDKPFVVQLAVQIITTANKVVDSFSNAVTQGLANSFVIGVGGNKLATSRRGDVGASVAQTTIEATGTGREVWSMLFDGTAVSLRRNGHNTSVVGATLNTGPSTLDQHTLFGFFGAGAGSLFANVRLRRRLFAPAFLTVSAVCVHVNEGEMLGEAA